MSIVIECPRCSQGPVAVKTVRAKGDVIRVCAECEAVWPSTWLDSGGGRAGSAFTHTFSSPVGITLRRGQSEAIEAFSVRVVLRPADLPIGYRVLTAFPEQR
ncbi:RNase A-like domain-containing protein [Nocardioides sp. DS6]|uniref:RNase A-like domain-containing protein n=1 Tax=Nocardioides eburneus TaxID=3231482 RepID=A0ABV3SVJ3_9ACTN